MGRRGFWWLGEHQVSLFGLSKPAIGSGRGAVCGKSEFELEGFIAIDSFCGKFLIHGTVSCIQGAVSHIVLLFSS